MPTMTTLNIFTLLQEAHPLLYIGLLLLCGYAGGELAHFFRFPRVSGYLVTGILLGPSGIGLFHSNLVHQELNIITHIALGIIAFSIGGSLEIGKITSLGRQIAWITICQTLGAVLVTTTILTLTLPFFYQTPDSNSLWHLFFPVALTVGAMSAATAPATILAVIHEYRARGPFTSTLLGVVALDDGLTIILYTIATTISGSLLHMEKLNWQKLFFSSAYPILVALVIGALLAAIIQLLIHLVPRSGAMLGVMLGFIFLGSGLGLTLEVSPLLVNMMMGFTIVNCVKHHHDFFIRIESLEEAIFSMFFTLAGAHLDIGVLQTAGGLALIIMVSRFTGKLLGSWFGATLSQAPLLIRRYLGLALLPKAGVTVGLILEAKGIFGELPFFTMILSGVLGSVLINELLAPLLTRFALQRAGEIEKY